MVFNLSNSCSDDGETPALTPVASPRACSGCVGIIRRFDGPGLQDRSRDGGAVGQLQDENPLGSNDSAGKVYGKKLVVKVDLHDDRDRRKAIQVVSRLGGIGCLAMDSKDNKLIVSGNFNTVEKLVVKVDLHDDRDRRKAIQVVSRLGGIGCLAMDSKDNKLIVSGNFNPVEVVNKLRKSWHTDIVSIEAAKEDHGKKEEGKKNKDQVANLVTAYQA